jgi:ankyrin repeat protein
MFHHQRLLALQGLRRINKSSADRGGPWRTCAPQDERNGNRPVHLAAQNGHLEIVQKLIRRVASRLAGLCARHCNRPVLPARCSLKANVNSQNKGGQTPLHMAKAYEYAEVATSLLSANADPTIVNGAGSKLIRLIRTHLQGARCGRCSRVMPDCVLQATKPRMESTGTSNDAVRAALRPSGLAALV